MRRATHLKKVRTLLLIQRVVLLLCIAIFVWFWIACSTVSTPRWVELTLGTLALLGISGVLLLNLLTRSAVKRTDNTLDAILRFGGFILVEEHDWTEADHIDPILLKQFETLLKDFLNLGSTQEIIRTQTNLVALQNQINPHFLYNTLDVIRSEALLEGANNTSDMIETLSRVFRYGISTKEDLVSLSSELKNVRDYFHIQQYRFGDRYALIINNKQQTNCDRVQIPKLTLQPLVENAILHAFHDQEGQGVVTICIDSSDRKVKITVSDNGCGMRQEDLRRFREKIRLEAHGAYPAVGRDTTGIALENINKRIKLFFGDDYGMSVFSLPMAGTDIVITLPAGREGG